MPDLRQLLPTTALVVMLSFFAGCSNPYLAGFTGQTNPPLDEEAHVEVVGANRADERSMQRFELAYAEAERGHQLLGSSTIVSGSRLRDAAAAEAGRELGATLVLYNFGYLTSTVETDHHAYPSSHHDDHGINHHYHHLERSSTSSTKHWYEYRAYFFAQ